MRTLPLATVLLVLSAGAAVPSDTARFQFCWIGAGGYTMEGVIGFPAELLGTGIITQADVTEFAIRGYLDGMSVGSWTMADRTTETSWTLFFDTRSVAFPMGGHFLEQSYQEWNANGQVDDCGKPGFGFNGGNWAQDFCIDNVWIEESSIDPDTPLPAYPMDQPMRCEAVLQLS
ncbi:hypothetical protein P6F26_00400 [Roseibacterium sp. SDUM158017]|uniref:hypothetical protein n=1 Tax=Roseicyclus salinarum TaxID=3036773 RepID=UPI0024151DBE|nr:hypothetical protein [Roseibacterium sp. SDUM158017]MDG4646889.1 hypothetical protein [Roseibacterium sp. SDUM158017]